MILGIHQPQYLPWLGLIDRIDKSDVFVLLDNVAYSRNYFYNRNRIKTSQGWAWLTVPVLFNGNFGQLIKDIRIDNHQNWRQKHLKSIYLEYKKTRFFEGYYSHLETLLSKEWELLSELSSESMRLVSGLFGLDKKIIMASGLGAEGVKEELLINIALGLKATKYISGPDGKDYIDPGNWQEKGIEVTFQAFQHPKYTQAHGEFLTQMSAIDLLFNCGPESLSIVRDPDAEKAKPVFQ